jgi:hypothetical protein
MKLDRDKLHEDILRMYRAEHEALGERGTLEMLERASQWDLSATLAGGGALVFPHAGVADCGYQIAAVVRACLDSGAEKVLVVSVLHAFTDEMEGQRIRVAMAAIRRESWSIQGPADRGEEGRRTRADHPPLLAGRDTPPGISGPQVIGATAGRRQARAARYRGTARARQAVLVSTADSFHGIGWRPTERSYAPEGGGLKLARRRIEEGITLLEKGDYWGYNQHCVEAKSDARDAGQVMRYLRGPMQGHIVDLTYSDASELYGQPPPTWVAAALVEWKK